MNIFTAVKYRCILHGRVCVMYSLPSENKHGGQFHQSFFFRSTNFLNLLTCLAIAMRYILDENLMKMDPDLGVYQPAHPHSFVVFCLYSANTL